MVYKIGSHSILRDSDGSGNFKTVLVTDEPIIASSIDSGSNIIFDLPSNHFETEFPVVEGYRGETAGFATGDNPSFGDTIDKWPFASDDNATEVGTLYQARRFSSGGSSSEGHGYTMGGQYPHNTTINLIDKFPFAISGSSSTDVGDLTSVKLQLGSQSSKTHGYASGGRTPSISPGYLNEIERFPFAADENAVDVGDMLGTFYQTGGNSGITHGYQAGGIGQTYSNVIEKFPFAAATTTSSDVGDLTLARYGAVATNSETHGYSSGGIYPSPPPTYSTSSTNIIEKFPFATDTNGSDVGDLSQSRGRGSKASSTTNGYNAGGHSAPPFSNKNTIDKFPFASDANATDVGNLTRTVYEQAGQQD